LQALSIAEVSVNAAEQLYRRWVSRNPDGMLIDIGGRIVYANDALRELIGARSSDQIVELGQNHR